MAIIDLKRLTLVALKKNHSAIMKTLQDLGSLHIIDTKEQEYGVDNFSASGYLDQLKSKAEGVRFALSFIKKYDDTKKTVFYRQTAGHKRRVAGVCG